MTVSAKVILTHMCHTLEMFGALFFWFYVLAVERLSETTKFLFYVRRLSLSKT